MDYKEAISQLKNTRYCNRRLIQINQDIEVLYHKASGLAHSGPELGDCATSSKLPMPHFTGDPNRSPVALIEAIEDKRQQARAYRALILNCTWIERIPELDRQIAMALFLAKKTPEEVGAEMGYTKQNLYRRLRKAVEDLED